MTTVLSPLALPIPALGGRRLSILAATQFRLELALQRSSPELEELAAIIRTDPVAVLLLFAHTGPRPSDSSLCLRDNILSLGRDGLVDALCRQRPARGAEGHIAHSFAQRAHTLAQTCRMVAEALGLPSEQGFLVGLLHNLGALPQELGWLHAPQDATSSQSLTLVLCRHYAVPPRLLAALDETERADPLSPWSAVVRAALDLLEARAASPAPPLDENFMRLAPDVRRQTRILAPPSASPLPPLAAKIAGSSGQRIATRDNR